MSIKLKTLARKPLNWLGVAAVLVVLAAVLLAYGWNKRTHNSEAVFWDMLSQSLSTSSVTVEASQSEGGRSMHQTLQYAFGAQNISHSLTTLSQGNTTVKDEMIGTTATDYSRYVSIKTDQKNGSGKPLNFASILGVWAKTPDAGKGSAPANAQLFTQAVLGTGLPLGGLAVPIANLSPDLKSQLLTQIRAQNVYRINFKEVKRGTDHGRPTYLYSATMQPILYASLMKRFAHDTGLHALDSLDVNNYQGQPALQLQLTVDARSRRLTRVTLVGTQVTQTYSAYDVPVSVAVPAHAIGVNELQQRLSAIVR